MRKKARSFPGSFRLLKSKTYCAPGSLWNLSGSTHMTGSMDVDARIEESLHLVGLDTYHLSRYPQKRAFRRSETAYRYCKEHWH